MGRCSCSTTRTPLLVNSAPFLLRLSDNELTLRLLVTFGESSPIYAENEFTHHTTLCSKKGCKISWISLISDPALITKSCQEPTLTDNSSQT